MVRIMTRLFGAAARARGNIQQPETFGMRNTKMLNLRGRRVRTIIAAMALFGGLAISDRGAVAAPVEYVKICNLAGVGYFYIPGTDICQDANQINTTQNALSSFTSTAYQGIAISSSIVAPFMPSNANFAVSGHWATFSGKDALGLGGLMRVNNSNFFLSGGIGASTTGGPAVGRAGFMMAW